MFLAIVLGLTSPGLSSAQDQAEQVDTVRPTFGWTAGHTARVTSQSLRIRGPEPEVRTEGGFRYLQSVSEEGDYLRVRASEPQLLAQGRQAGLPARIQGAASGMMPDFLVSRSGELIGLYDLPGVQARNRDILTALLGDETAGQNPEPLIEQLLSEAHLTSRVVEVWNAVVGSWAGAELDIGWEYAMDAREPIPVLQGAEVLMNYVVSANGRVPCREGETTMNCVELEMRSAPDPADFAILLERFMSQSADLPPDAFSIKGIELENSLILITEPDTLVPHAYRTQRFLSVTGMENGAEKTSTQFDQTLVQYSYE